MTAVRDFLRAFSIAAIVLMALVSFVFLGSTLMNEFVTIADMGRQLVAAAIVAVVLAVPLAAVGTTSRNLAFIDSSSA